MNSYSRTPITIGCMIIFSLITGLISFDLVNGQTNIENERPSNIPIDDQARYLRGLETRDSGQWNFATSEAIFTDVTYQLSISDPDVHIVEQDIPEWRNTGEAADYSVLVDVYEFTEEEIIP
ncbi:MAG TPA: hypothetical protein ACFCUY_04090 [Xenococcaceae cyanobacterium]